MAKNWIAFTFVRLLAPLPGLKRAFLCRFGMLRMGCLCGSGAEVGAVLRRDSIELRERDREYERVEDREREYERLRLRLRDEEYEDERERLE